MKDTWLSTYANGIALGDHHATQQISNKSASSVGEPKFVNEGYRSCLLLLNRNTFGSVSLDRVALMVESIANRVGHRILTFRLIHRLGHSSSIIFGHKVRGSLDSI